jgi:hypothetical protein
MPQVGLYFFLPAPSYSHWRLSKINQFPATGLPVEVKCTVRSDPSAILLGFSFGRFISKTKGHLHGVFEFKNYFKISKLIFKIANCSRGFGATILPCQIIF